MSHISIWEKSGLGRGIDSAKVLGQEFPGLLEGSGRACQSVQCGAEATENDEVRESAVGHYKDLGFYRGEHEGHCRAMSRGMTGSGSHSNTIIYRIHAP